MTPNTPTDLGVEVFSPGDNGNGDSTIRARADAGAKAKYNAAITASNKITNHEYLLHPPEKLEFDARCLIEHKLLHKEVQWINVWMVYICFH